MKEGDINEICLKNGLKKLSVSNFPTWIDKSSNEGIELKAGLVKTFRIHNNEKIYNETYSDKIEKLMKEIGENGDKSNNKPDTIKPPIVKGNEGDIITLIPDNITKPLLEKWKNLTTFDRMLMFQRTAPEYVKHKPKGNKEISYVEGNLMQKEANIAFLFCWEDKIEGFHFSDNAVACYGYVSVNIDGKKITHSAVGVDLQEYRKADNKPVFTQEELMKSAHTDMIKKALSKFGFNSDVYGGEI